MAIKKLQINFTTPEQSKRLLELGMPADSADCVLENLDTAENNFQSEDYTRWIIEKRHVNEDIFCERNEGIFLPCWSAARLIEIFLKCSPYKDIAINESNIIEQMIVSIFMVNKEGLLDLSKLEE